MTAEIKLHQCPLCSLEFEDGWACHSSCPISAGCGMIRCPQCRYEFVTESRVVNIFRKLVEAARKQMRSQRC